MAVKGDFTLLSFRFIYLKAIKMPTSLHGNTNKRLWWKYHFNKVKVTVKVTVMLF